MKVNNFKLLEKQELSKYNTPNKDVHRNINSSVGVIQFIGSMVDLFVTKFIGAALGSTGDSGIKPKSKSIQQRFMGR